MHRSDLVWPVIANANSQSELRAETHNRCLARENVRAINALNGRGD